MEGGVRCWFFIESVLHGGVMYHVDFFPPSLACV